ncbi:PREDICTED: uncharacterized protein LOC108358888 [Rhagoletis zephyria]|uniref:uncharacterized protein LOC108358888 n=1 Tax=Rhagoletis zephyria TaxID=28612 RepID=UPI000811933D|nr:PREDICTED: uncharacterized protein LOC108358888 [Rhagoletis zephyria]
MLQLQLFRPLCQRLQKDKAGSRIVLRMWREGPLCNRLQAVQEGEEYFQCLVDSGSPVSLMKEVVVPSGVNFDEVNDSYYGLNKSVSNILGKVKCIVKVLNKDVLVEFLVDPNGCIGYSVLLGRDFIEASTSRGS